MSGVHYPLWELDLPAEEFAQPVEFKFGLWDERAERLVQCEDGPNRLFHGVPPGPDVLVVNYEHYRHAGLVAWGGRGDPGLLAAELSAAMASASSPTWRCSPSGRPTAVSTWCSCCR